MLAQIFRVSLASPPLPPQPPHTNNSNGTVNGTVNTTTTTLTSGTTPASRHSQHNLSLIFAHLAFHRGAGVVHERRQPQLPARFPVGGRDHVVPVGGAERIAVGRKARGPGGVARGCPAGGDRSAAAEGVVPVSERNGIARKTSSDKKKRDSKEKGGCLEVIVGSRFNVSSRKYSYLTPWDGGQSGRWAR